jgi:hypothetical protein
MLGSTSGGGQMTPLELSSFSLRVRPAELLASVPCADGLLLRRVSVAGSEQGFGSSACGGADGV